MDDVVKTPTDFYAAYIFDMDGTIYLGDHLLPGAKRMIEQLHERNIPVRYLSNNPTKDPAEYAQKLARLGLPTPVEEIVNTVVTTVRWLQANHPDAVVYPISEEPLKRALTEAGFKISEDPSEIDVVIASYDRTFEYRKLQIAFDAIWFYKRAILIATNPDRFCPFPGGHGQPDAASIIAAIEACTDTKCVANLGKPNPVMLTASLAGLDVESANCVMVGDRLQTDIQMALDTGMASAMTLTGEATLDDVRARAQDQRPRYILDRIDKLIPLQYWPQLGWSEDD